VMVTIDQESNIIRLVHYTTEEHFKRIRLQRFPNAQRDITETCLTYLLFDILDTVRRSRSNCLECTLLHISV
jgi:hypothetical protein